MSKTNIVFLTSSGRPAKDPNARCDGCGIIGTVGNAHRTVDGVVSEMYVYCNACWPEHSARLKARWREQARIASESRMGPDADPAPSVGWGFESKTWYDVLQGVEMMNRILDTPPRPSPEQLASIAAEIVKNADELEGPMPLTVQFFVREHSVSNRHDG